MKFLVLIYQPETFDPKSLPAEDHAAIRAEYRRIASLPNVSPGATLGQFQLAKTVRIEDGKPVITQGPVSSGGVISAYWTVEAASESEVLELVSDIPAAKLGGAVEVRPDGIYW